MQQSIRMLVSVKNVDEASLALRAGVDFIDLKDPENGALGSLENSISSQIVKVINHQVEISATTGDHHEDIKNLMEALITKHGLGVDIIKLPYSHLLDDENNQLLLAQAVQHFQLRLYLVIFADRMTDWNILSKLPEIGFQGAMLDTADKGAVLTQALNRHEIANFVAICRQNQLQSGLAGGLRLQSIPELGLHQPDFMGFRSGVCQNNQRKGNLDGALLANTVETLRNHNSVCFTDHVSIG